MIRDLLISDNTCGNQRLHNSLSAPVRRGSLKDDAIERLNTTYRKNFRSMEAKFDD